MIPLMQAYRLVIYMALAEFDSLWFSKETQISILFVCSLYNVERNSFNELKTSWEL